MNLRHLFVMASAFAATGAIGAAPPPSAPSLHGVTTKSPPVTAVTLGSLEVALEVTTLSEVIDGVGFGLIEHNGDAGESEYWICYRTDDSLIWIVSDGEMGGEKHAVTRIAALRRTQQTDVAGCSASAVAKSLLVVNGKLKLSVPTSKVATLPGGTIGKPGSFSFDYQGKSGTSDSGRCPPDGFDIENWLMVVSDQGTVNEIHLGQISSC